MSNYNPPSHPAEYGGGGSTGANYYDPRADFSSSQPYQQQQQSQYSGGNYGSGGGGRANFDPTFSDAYKQARYAKNGKDNVDPDDDDDDDEDASIFKRALGFLSENKDRFNRHDDDDVDEQQIVGAHKALYGNDNVPDRKLDANFLGGGAAVQALKMFTSGEGRQNDKGAGDQNKLIGLAMAQAGKLWEQQNSQGKVVRINQC